MKDAFSELSFKELQTKRVELNEKYRNLRFNMVIGHVDNPLEKRTLRRKLSRLNTLVHEYETGIRKAQE